MATIYLKTINAQIPAYFFLGDNVINYVYFMVIEYFHLLRNVIQHIPN